MRFEGVGVREVVALLVLAVGLVLGFAFFDPTSTESTPTPRAMPTAVPRPLAEGLGTWTVTFTEGADLASAIPIGTGEYPTLDFRFESGPFPDVKDDAWAVYARTTFAGPAGRYLLNLEYDGEIQLLIDDDDRRISPPDGSGSIVIPFEHAESEATRIMLRLRDTGGVAVLSAKVTQ